MPVKLRDYLSKSEIRMFKGLPLNHLLNAPLEVIPFYRMVMEEVFKKNLVGPNVEALRSCINTIDKCKIYRCTNEYDSMIENILNA